jgi:predicted lipoprotein with Yx(FWY)xxD motif
MHGSDRAPGAADSHAPAPPAGSIKLRTAIVGHRTILVNAVGRTLYVFAPDHHSRVSCNQSCQATWPPEIAPASGRATAERGVRAGLIGSDPNPAGGRVVTYAGWPLYTFSGDNGAGQENGEGLDLNGGRWYVITPAGHLVK